MHDSPSRFRLALLCPLLLLACGRAAGKSPTQILLITLDTTRADYLGLGPGGNTLAPRLDALAEDSVVFSNCYSTTHSTMPSHTSLFTSSYLKDHGLISMGQVLPEYDAFLPKVFQRAGFRTAAFTSGGHLTPKVNIDQGFDSFRCPDAKENRAEVTRVQVVEWIRSNQRRDFFAWVHFFDPHMPYEPVPPFDRSYDDSSTESLLEVPIKNASYVRDWSYFDKSEDPQYYRNLYRGEISYLDGQIGLLIDALRETGIYDDCTIVLIADHGEYLGEHTIYFHHGGGIHDEVIHVPLLVKAAKREFTGHRDHLVSSVDVYPTILELVGMRPPGPIRGESLVPLMQDPASPEVRETVYYESVWRLEMGIKTREHTYLRHLHDVEEFEEVDGFKIPRSLQRVLEAGGKEELYDNVADPRHSENLAATQRAIAGAFNERALAFADDVLALGSDPGEIEDPAQLELLKELGYTE